MTAPKNSITASRQSKLNAPILPQEPNDDKMPVARQHYMAMRRFAKLALQRSDYTVREIETRLYPTLRHAGGCPAVADDEMHCLADVYEVEHTTQCLATKAKREAEIVATDAAVAPGVVTCECPKTLVKDGCPDRELRMTLRCILESLIDLTEQAPVRKFGTEETYLFPTRDGYTAMVVEIEYLRDRLAELEPGSPPRIGAPEISPATQGNGAEETNEARS